MVVMELSQEPYTKLEAVVNYVQGASLSLDKLEKDVVDTKFSKVAKNRMEYVDILIGVASRELEVQQWDQSLGNIEKARGVVDELNQVCFPCSIV